MHIHAINEHVYSHKTAQKEEQKRQYTAHTSLHTYQINS